MSDTSGLCAPFIIYVVLSALSVASTLMYTKRVDGTVLAQALAYVVVAAVLYFLCKTGHKNWAWFLLLLPLILFLVVIVLLIPSMYRM